MSEQTLLTYFGHHKCASSWANNINHQACHGMGLKFVNCDKPSQFGEDAGRFVRDEGIDFWGFSNAEPKYLDQIESMRGYHIIRDPRDIVVSAYFSHRNTHTTESWPELVELRENLLNHTEPEGLVFEMDFLSKNFKDMYDWDYTRDDIYEVKMEDVIAKSYEVMVEAFRFMGVLDESSYSVKDQARFLARTVKTKLKQRLGLKQAGGGAGGSIARPQFLDIVYSNRFSAKAGGRKQGEEDRGSHYRKGVAGDWVNYFDDDIKKAFTDRFDDLLVKLGYETDNDSW